MTMFTKHSKVLASLAAMSLTLTGCISLGAGAEPPTSLLTLSPISDEPSEEVALAGDQENFAIAVLTPETPAKLDIVRVPVNVSGTEIAYLQEAVWVEKPARLFRRLLGETLRERLGDDSIVLDSDDTPLHANIYVRGTLMELSYDAPSNSVVASYQTIITLEDGSAFTRRFEAREENVPAEVEFVGPALNRVANEAASDAADWVLSGREPSE